MKYIKVTILMAIIGFNTSALATGSKREPPLALEKSLIEVIIDVLTFE